MYNIPKRVNNKSSALPNGVSTCMNSRVKSAPCKTGRRWDAAGTPLAYSAPRRAAQHAAPSACNGVAPCGKQYVTLGCEAGRTIGDGINVTAQTVTNVEIPKGIK